MTPASYTRFNETMPYHGVIFHPEVWVASSFFTGVRGCASFKALMRKSVAGSQDSQHGTAGGFVPRSRDWVRWPQLQ